MKSLFFHPPFPLTIQKWTSSSRKPSLTHSPLQVHKSNPRTRFCSPSSYHGGFVTFPCKFHHHCIPISWHPAQHTESLPPFKQEHLKSFNSLRGNHYCIKVNYTFIKTYWTWNLSLMTEGHGCNYNSLSRNTFQAFAVGYAMGSCR